MESLKSLESVIKELKEEDSSEGTFMDIQSDRKIISEDLRKELTQERELLLERQRASQGG